MADYSRYKTETLRRMQNEAAERYHRETMKKSRGDEWGAGMRLAKLPENKAWDRARIRYDEITAELDKRFKAQRESENKN